MSRLGEVAAAIGPADVSTLIALRALAGADDGVNAVPRARWLTALREEYRRWYGGAQAPENFPEGETLRYLHEHCVPTLAGAAVIELLGEDGEPLPLDGDEVPGWAAARLSPWAVDEVLADRRAALAALDARVAAVLGRAPHGEGPAGSTGFGTAPSGAAAFDAPPAPTSFDVPAEESAGFGGSVETGPAEAHAAGRRPSMKVPGGLTLAAKGLVKSYRGRRVVNEVDVHVAQGEIVGLLGPNGAGKTTSFYMIVGLINPDRGRVFIGERDLTGVPMYKRARAGIGYLAQEPSIFRKLTVEENVRAILQMLGIPRAEQNRRLEVLLGELGLTRLRKSKAYALSGGERRRLEITRALVGEPRFMLLDEPFAGVDPIAVHDIQQIVSDLRRRGIGVLISDHNVEQTLDIVDRAYIMYDGRVRVSGTVSELVWNDEVAEIYLGPTLTARMRERYPNPEDEPAAALSAAPAPYAGAETGIDLQNPEQDTAV